MVSGPWSVDRIHLTTDNGQPINPGPICYSRDVLFLNSHSTRNNSIFGLGESTLFSSLSTTIKSSAYEHSIGEMPRALINCRGVSHS